MNEFLTMNDHLLIIECLGKGACVLLVLHFPNTKVQEIFCV